MTPQIQYFVEQIESTLMLDILEYNELDLYDIATDLISHNDDAMFADICQAYEVVKHHLLGEEIKPYRPC